MLQLGVFTSWIKADSIEQLAERIAAYGMQCVVLDSFPGMDVDLESPDADDSRRIRAAFEQASVTIAAVGGYSNLLQPNPNTRAAIHRKFKGLIRLCEGVNSPMLCSETGTYHPSDDWAWDPANATDQALTHLAETIRPLAEYAEQYGVILGFEPYVMNVCYTAERATRFVREVGARNVQLVADPAGLLTRATLDAQDDVLPDAFTHMAPYLGLVHAEDCLPDPNDHFQWLGAGKGKIDYTLFMGLVKRSGYKGPIILEHLSEEELPAAREHVRLHWNKA